MLLNLIQTLLDNIWQIVFFCDVIITLVFIISAFSLSETPKQMACDEVSKRFRSSCLC